MFRFENEIILWGLAIIPLLSLLFIAYLYQKHKRMARFAEMPLFLRITPQYSAGKPVVKFSLLMLALTLLIFTLANPQLGSKVEKVERKGVDLIICLDVSNSMNAEDIQPSRLKRSKQAIIRLLEKLKTDRIGVVIFAGSAYTQLPLTSDYGAARMFIDLISTNDIRSQGTAIGAAIEQAIAGFEAEDGDKKKNRAVIVISDGENHEDNAVDAAKEALRKDIIVHTIGMGLPDGTPIPVAPDNRALGYKKDAQGQMVLTKLNESMLQQIAEAGGGSYVGANNTEAGVETIFEKINKMDKKAYEARNFSDFQTRYAYPLIIALLLLIIELLIFDKKNKFFNRQNLFHSKS